MSIKLSVRHEPVTKAHIELAEKVADVVGKYGLTYAELISILGQEIQSWTKSAIRDERNGA